MMRYWAMPSAALALLISWGVKAYDQPKADDLASDHAAAMVASINATAPKDLRVFVLESAKLDGQTAVIQVSNVHGSSNGFSAADTLKGTVAGLCTTIDRRSSDGVKFPLRMEGKDAWGNTIQPVTNPNC